MVFKTKIGVMKDDIRVKASILHAAHPGSITGTIIGKSLNLKL